MVYSLFHKALGLQEVARLQNLRTPFDRAPLGESFCKNLNKNKSLVGKCSHEHSFTDKYSLFKQNARQ